MIAPDARAVILCHVFCVHVLLSEYILASDKIYSGRTSNLSTMISNQFVIKGKSKFMNSKELL